MTLKEDYKNAFNGLYITVMVEKRGTLQSKHVDTEFFRRAGAKEIAGYFLTFYPQNWRTSMECMDPDIVQDANMELVGAMLEAADEEQEKIREQIASGEIPAAEKTAGQEGTAGGQQEKCAPESSPEAAYARALEDALYAFHSLRRLRHGTPCITDIVTEKLGSGREINEWLQANLVNIYRK